MRENGAFESVAALRADRQTLTARGSPVQIRVARVTASFYSTVRVAPVIGRAPGADEDPANAGHTVVLTDDYWRHELNADPDVLGRTLTLDGRVYTIGGVMPRGFHFALLRDEQVLLPVAFDQIEIERRGRMPFAVVARLKPGLSVREAQADLDVVGPRIAGRIVEHLDWRHEARPLLEDLVGPVKPALTALLGVALGLTGALAATRALASMVYGVSTTDPLTMAAASALLLGAASLASWVPAIRAARLDPAVSLRAG